MKAFGIVAVLLAFVVMPTQAEGGAAIPPASPIGTQDGRAAGAGKGNGERPTPRSLPTTKEKQRAIDAATRAGSTQGGTALGDRGPPKPEKTWDEMTPQEQDAARKRWLLNSGDFGPRRGIPRATPSPSTEKGGAVIDGPRPPTPQEKIRTK